MAGAGCSAPLPLPQRKGTTSSAHTPCHLAVPTARLAAPPVRHPQRSPPARPTNVPLGLVTTRGGKEQRGAVLQLGGRTRAGCLGTAVGSLRAEPSPSESTMTPLHPGSSPGVPPHPHHHGVAQRTPSTPGSSTAPPVLQVPISMVCHVALNFCGSPTQWGAPQHPQVPITIGSPAASPALGVSGTTVCHISGVPITTRFPTAPPGSHHHGLSRSTLLLWVSNTTRFPTAPSALCPQHHGVPHNIPRSPSP